MDLKFEEQFPSFKIKYPYNKMVNGEIRQVTVGYVPKDYNQLKQDDSFRVLLSQVQRYRDYKMTRYYSCKVFVSTLQKEIEEELAQRK